MRWLLAAVAVMVLAAPARAQPQGEAVALLPLDADQRLELYGQPVASEIARTLIAGGIEVVVVGPKMAVPPRARLVVDGTITPGKGDAVILYVRVRDPRDGTVVETHTATAPALTNIDRAAEEVSGRVLRSVQARLAALAHPKPEAPHEAGARPAPPVVPVTPKPVLAVVMTRPGLGPDGDVLTTSLAAALGGWAAEHHLSVKTVDAAALAPGLALKTVAGSGAELALAFEVVGFVATPGPVPTSRARVRVRAIDGAHVAFDRVIVTDTIVGDRGMAAAALAARTAREVLMISEPHLRRAIATWR